MGVQKTRIIPARLGLFEYRQGAGREFRPGVASCKVLRIRKQFSLLVFGGKCGYADVGPLYADGRIIPGNAAFMFRRVVIGGFVEKFRRLRQHDKAMRKALWHPHLAVVISRQYFTDPLPEGG